MHWESLRDSNVNKSMFFHPATLGHLPTSSHLDTRNDTTTHTTTFHTPLLYLIGSLFFSLLLSCLFPLQAGGPGLNVYIFRELKVCCSRSRYWSVVYKCLLFGRHCTHPPHITLSRGNPPNSVMVPTPLVHPQPGNITLAFLNKQLGNSSQPAPPTPPPPTSRPLLTPWQWR